MERMFPEISGITVSRFVSRLERAAEKLEVFRDLAVLLLQFLDPAHTVHDGRVVPVPEATPDFGKTAGGQLLGEVHRHLSRTREGAESLGPYEVAQADVVVLGHLALDLLDRDLALGRAERSEE